MDIMLIVIAAYWVMGLVSYSLFRFFEVDSGPDEAVYFLFWPFFLLMLFPLYLISKIPTLSQIKARRLEAKKREDDDPLANLIDAL
jgi:hypothetical protein